MTIKASDVPAASDLLKSRSQLLSRLAAINSQNSLGDLLGLLVGTGLEAQTVAIAKQQMTQYFQNAIATVEQQITALGVDLTL